MKTVKIALALAALPLTVSACALDVDDEGATTGTDESVASVEQAVITTFLITSRSCPYGSVCVFWAADWDTGNALWNYGYMFVGCGWKWVPTDIANQISAITNNGEPGKVSYFYDANGDGPDIYLGQSPAYDHIRDLQARVAADGSNPNDRIDYVHVTRPGCVE